MPIEPTVSVPPPSRICPAPSSEPSVLSKPARSSAVLLAMVAAEAVPNDPLVPARSAPPSSCSAPLNAPAPAKVSVPAPLLASRPAPVTEPAKVALVV